MCGIAGIVNYLPEDIQVLKRALKHRGPDDQQSYVDKQFALIHTRLAIQDIARGQQPFVYQHLVISFNGEIYNHMALREHLSEFTFQTTADTETLLFLYLKYQEKLFALVDGMFAFCIYDKLQHTLFIARDRSGKKPLYYYQGNHQFLFASELNAIKAIRKLSIDEEAIAAYLRVGFIYKQFTPYREVRELEAGSYMTVNLCNGELKICPYFSLFELYHQQASPLPYQEALEQVERTLKQSVQQRLMASDVEVGAFLSGGIDSNLVVAIAAQSHPGIKTFTVKFAGSYDESPLAELAARHYQTAHTTIEVHFDLENDIERILLSYGEPFMDSSAIPSYYVAQEASRFVKVILNGDGADELFAGYRRYVAIAHQLPRLSKWLTPLAKWTPRPKNKQSLYHQLHRLIGMANKTGLDFYLSATNDLYEDIYRFPHNKVTAQMQQFIIQTLQNNSLSPLAKMLYLDFNLLLFSDLLVKMDIATMAHALEGRSPFLSTGMLNLAPTLPDHYKIKHLTTKYILRDLAKKYLPKKLIHLPKRGFEVPLKAWVTTTLKNNIFDSLMPGCYSETYLPRTWIDQLLADKVDVSAEKRAKIVWGLFCLEVWHRHEVC